jgi:hypothetical protein
LPSFINNSTKLIDIYKKKINLRLLYNLYGAAFRRIYIIIGRVVSADATSSLIEVTFNTSDIIFVHYIIESSFSNEVLQLSICSNANLIKVLIISNHRLTITTFHPLCWSCECPDCHSLSILMFLF